MHKSKNCAKRVKNKINVATEGKMKRKDIETSSEKRMPLAFFIASALYDMKELTKMAEVPTGFKSKQMNPPFHKY